MNGLVRRLAALEARLVAASPEDAARAEAFRRAFSALIETMAPEHVALLVDGLRARVQMLPHVGDGARHLATCALRLVDQHLDAECPPFRLALPAAVADVLLKHPPVWLFDRCTACRLGLPFSAEYWRGGTPMVRVPAVHYFERCPECGGAIEHDDYGFARPRDD